MCAQWIHTGETRRKCNLLDVISRVFPSKFQQIHTASVSSHCILYMFKTCQIVAGTSMIRQFHKFSNLIFGGILLFGPTLVRQLRCGNGSGTAKATAQCKGCAVVLLCSAVSFARLFGGLCQIDPSVRIVLC